MQAEAQAALRLGVLQFAAGSSAYRVIRAVKRCARSLGFDRADIVVGFNSLSCTFYYGEDFRTVVSAVPLPGVNASRIEAIETLTHVTLHRHTTAARVNAELDAIEMIRSPRWGVATSSLAAGVACGGFAVLNHFTLLSAAVVVVAAAIGQSLRVTLAHARLNQLGVVALSGIVASSLYLLLAHMVSAFAPIQSSGFVASILFLVPGFPLFTALLDLARFDFAAGIPRLFYALEVVVAMMLSVATVGMIFGAERPLLGGAPDDPAFLAAATVASFLSVSGFALIFNSSRRMVLTAATVGCAANLVHLLLVSTGMETFLASFLAALFVGVAGVGASRRVRVPRVTVTIPATIVLLPGARMYAAVHALVQGDIYYTIAIMAEVSLILLFLMAGLGMARILTDRDWAFQNYINFSQKLDDPLIDDRGVAGGR